MGVGPCRGGLATKLSLCCAALLAVGLIGAGSAAAAPPANDNFANAATLTNGSVISTNVQATKQAGEPNHAGDRGGASVWYSWTAPSTGKFEVTTCGSQFDTLLAVYTGSALNALTPIAANDEAFRCPSQSDLVFQATSGVNYKLAVDGWSDSGAQPADTGNFLLSVSAVMPPYNDSFSAPTDEGGDSDWNALGDNIGATKQAGEPNHAGNAGGHSVWYLWDAPITGRYRLNTCYTEFDTVLAVYKGSAVNALTPTASDHDSCGGFGSFIEFDAVAGTDYRIAVDGFGGATGNFEIDMHHLNPPPNDNFASAQLLSGANVQVAGTNVDASTEPGEPSNFFGPAFESVWYTWTAPVSGQLTLDTCSGDIDSVLTVFSGSALNGLTRLVGNDDAPNCGLDGESRVVLHVNGGTTYRIAVDGYYEGDFLLKLAFVPGAAGVLKDTAAPNSKIKKVVVDSDHGKAKIIFGSGESGDSYQCKLDKAKYRSCHSPKTFRHLDVGKHKVKVLATDVAGNTDPTPAVRKFKIEP